MTPPCMNCSGCGRRSISLKYFPRGSSGHYLFAVEIDGGARFPCRA
jgi:hypothetical protein